MNGNEEFLPRPYSVLKMRPGPLRNEMEAELKRFCKTVAENEKMEKRLVLREQNKIKVTKYLLSTILELTTAMKIARDLGNEILINDLIDINETVLNTMKYIENGAYIFF